jgi:KaiC/GvpD/RAD55 family RecA-like ATPase
LCISNKLTLLYIENYPPIIVKNSDLKIRTGIPGFDLIIDGGLKEGKTVVLSGESGSGKSTFGMQFLYNGALDFEEPGIFVTLSQSPQELINDFSSYGWEIERLMEEEKLLMIDARPFKMNDECYESGDFLYESEPFPFTHLTQMILQGIKKIRAKRLVIDSLSVLSMQYGNQFNTRQGIQKMIQFLDEKKCTSIFISENIESRTPPEWYAASGIVILNHTQKTNTMERTIQVIKMRGTKHSEQIYPIRFNENGYHVLHPRLQTLS